MRVLKVWVETVIVLITCINSILCVGCVEADNYLPVVPCLIINLVLSLIICKYGRGE